MKRYAQTPKESKPHFDWRGVAAESELRMGRNLRVEVNGKTQDFDLAEIAETIGEALTDLHLSRKDSEIFTEENRAFVAAAACAVAREMEERAGREEEVEGRDGGGAVGAATLSAQEIYAIMEQILVRSNAHDVARSVVHRSERFSGEVAGKPSLRVIRRNGHVVPWNANKIEIAVRKAFLSLELESNAATEIADAVTAKLAMEKADLIGMEELQDAVEEELMRQGHYKVASAYIRYRAHRAEQRRVEKEKAKAERNREDPDQGSMILVRRADGSTDLWDGSDLRRRVEFAAIGLDLCLGVEEIERELTRAFFSEMDEADLRETVILNAKTLIERDADFTKFAARILLSYIYEEVLGWDVVRDGAETLGQFHRRAFRRNMQRAVEIGRVDARLLRLNLDRLAEALDPSADLEFDYLGVQTLYDRYLIIDKTGSAHVRVEVPQHFWMRVAMGLFCHEDEPEERIIDLYRLYKGRRFCSSTPTLFNSGTAHSQLSSCYLYQVSDSIESIMQRGIAENAYLSKWAGGLGGSWTAVRGTGSYIHGTNGESQGVIPFLKLHNDQLVAVNQGGKRRGSGCAYLETWHNDITDFLDLRKNTGDDRRRTHDLNTANWIPDLFMKRMELREDWTLFRSSETPDLHELYGKAFEKRYEEYERMAEEGRVWSRKIAAIELWKRMLKALFETGHPWMTFKDACNVRSPQDHCGVIHSSNLCTEITLNTGPDETAVCNLGSVVLENHLDEAGELDHAKLRETVRTAVRALDNVIDINFYPTKAAQTANQRHRPIGLGVMGLQNALHKKGIAFASEAAVEFNDEFMEAIAYYAYEASSDLAKERGTYSSYSGSKWERGILPQDTVDLLEEERGQKIDVPRGGKMDWAPLREKIAHQGMRNSNVLAIAPTATISNIMGSTPCIEPSYKNLYVKSNLSGDFTWLNGYLVRDLKAAGIWGADMLAKLKYHDGEMADMADVPEELKRRYQTAFGIDFRYFIEAAARRQKWIDQSQSVNLFMADQNMKTLSHMYRAAWGKGLKTTYYLRTLAASNIEKATVDKKVEIRGVLAGEEGDRESTAEERAACSLEALLNGGECEMCQ